MHIYNRHRNFCTNNGSKLYGQIMATITTDNNQIYAIARTRIPCITIKYALRNNNTRYLYLRVNMPQTNGLGWQIRPFKRNPRLTRGGA